MRVFISIILLAAISANAQVTDRGKISPLATELWAPKPPKVTPANSASDAPSDAIVLFNGKDLSNWVSDDGSAPKWDVKDGVVTVKPGTGGIKTKQKFGDVQIHIEWRAPSIITGSGQDRGNSGVYLQERYEIQVLDSYENETYANGQAGALYKQSIPMVNATRKPGEWQTYDIIYTAPRFSEKGALIIPAYVTVLHNGIVIQNHQPFYGKVENQGLPQYTAHGDASLQLQEHSCLVSYRNIWIREL